MQPSHAPPDARTDAMLVQHARTDPGAFGALYDRYVERIYRYVYRRLGSHPDAEDVTSMTFHRALEGLGRYEASTAPFGAWLFRIAHNAVIDRYRAGARAETLNGALKAEVNGSAAPALLEDSVLAAEEAAGVWAAVRRLPPMQQRAVVLRFARGLSHAEIGVIIGRSEAATKQLIYRAMLTLRARLGETE